MGFLDYRKKEVKDLGIHPGDCSFNPGVFVADISEWKKQKITKQLEKWMEENFRYVKREAVYGNLRDALCHMSNPERRLWGNVNIFPSTPMRTI